MCINYSKCSQLGVCQVGQQCHVILIEPSASSLKNARFDVCRQVDRLLRPCMLPEAAYCKLGGLC